MLVSGSPTKEFSMGRGLRRGDLLSPFFFLLTKEGFNLMMDKSVKNEFGNGEVKVSLIQYEDDTIIVGRRS